MKIVLKIISVIQILQCRSSESVEKATESYFQNRTSLESPKNLPRTLIFYTNVDVAVDDYDMEDDDDENYDDSTTNLIYQDDVVPTGPTPLSTHGTTEKEVTESTPNEVETNFSTSTIQITKATEPITNEEETTSNPEIFEFDDILDSNLTVKNVTVQNKTRIVDISGNLQIKIKENFDKIKNSLSTTDKKFQQSLLQKFFITLLEAKPGFSPFPWKDRLDSIMAQYNLQINDGYFGQFTPPPPPFLWSKLKEKKQEILNHFGWGPNYDYPYPYRSLRLNSTK